MSFMRYSSSYHPQVCPLVITTSSLTTASNQRLLHHLTKSQLCSEIAAAMQRSVSSVFSRRITFPYNCATVIHEKSPKHRCLGRGLKVRKSFHVATANDVAG